MMRNSVFCAIPAEAAEPGELQDRILASIHAMVAEVQDYVPGYHLRADPQFDHARDTWKGMARVFVPDRGQGPRRLPARLRGQPRHHHRGRGPGRRHHGRPPARRRVHVEVVGRARRRP